LIFYHKYDNIKEEMEEKITRFLSGGGCEIAQGKEWLSILLHFSQLMMPLTSISRCATSNCVCKRDL